MYRGLSVIAVVPVFNEQAKIGEINITVIVANRSERVLLVAAVWLRGGAHHCGRPLHSHLLPEWLRAQRVHPVARRLLPVARGLLRALPGSCQGEDRRDRALLALASSAVPLRRAPEHRALLLRLRRPTRRGATANMRLGCGLLYHRATS